MRALSTERPDSRRLSDAIQICAFCGRPPAATIQVGTGLSVFWFECKTCGKKTDLREGFHEARLEWNSLQALD